jgi:predicted  nucleic acid-binding Zn-ribbon protein
MECEASDASKARDRARAELATLSEEFKGLRAKHSALQESHAALQAEHAELQEDHSILKEELGQLEEKHTETLEQLKESQASVERVSKGKLVAEERYKHFQGEHRKATLELRESQTKAANYLHQLSFTSRVRDAAWANGIHLRFETFRTWWRDPAQRVDLNSVNIEDILCTNEAIHRLLSLGREEMPDAAGIAEFDYRPSSP